MATRQYSHLIQGAIDRRKRKQQEISADKQRFLELEEKYKKQSLYVEELQNQIGELQDACKAFEISINLKQELYRESVSRIVIEKRKENGEPFNFEDCQEIHSKILSRLEDKKFSTKALIAEKERELIRSYESKMSELRLKNEQLRAKQGKGADEYVSRIRKLEEENDWMKQVSSKVEVENKQVMQTNQELSQQLSTLEQDRAFLIKQVIAVKKENKNLHLLLLESSRKPKNHKSKAITIGNDEEKENELASTISATNPNTKRVRKRPQSAMTMPPSRVGGKTSNYASFSRYHTMDSESAKSEIDNRFMDVINKLKKQLNSEKERSKRFEYKLNQRINEENELQRFLKQSLEQVQAEIHEHMKKKKSNRTHSASFSPRHENDTQLQRPQGNATKLTLDEMQNTFDLKQFDEDDKKEVLRVLLTKDSVLTILYCNMFPSSLQITNQFDDKMGKKQNKKKFKKPINGGGNPLNLSSFPLEQFAKKRKERIVEKPQLQFVKDIALKAFE